MVPVKWAPSSTQFCLVLDCGTDGHVCFLLCPGFSCAHAGKPWNKALGHLGPYVRVTFETVKWEGCLINDVELGSDRYQSSEHIYVPNFICLVFLFATASCHLLLPVN